MERYDRDHSQHDSSDRNVESTRARDANAVEEQVWMGLRVPKSIRTELKMYAAKVGRSLREVAVEALDEYLSRRRV